MVSVSCFLFFTVEGSASWRIPLGVQLIPGIVLAIGSIFLPPSPRLLVAQGRNDEALRTLARLRLRSEHEVQDDPLLQVRCSTFYYHLLPLSAVYSFLFPFTLLLPRRRSSSCHCLHLISPKGRHLFILFHTLPPARRFSGPTLISDMECTIFYLVCSVMDRLYEPFF